MAHRSLTSTADPSGVIPGFNQNYFYCRATFTQPAEPVHCQDTAMFSQLAPYSAVNYILLIFHMFRLGGSYNILIYCTTLIILRHKFFQLRPNPAAETTGAHSWQNRYFSDVVAEKKFSRGRPASNEQQITAAMAK